MVVPVCYMTGTDAGEEAGKVFSIVRGLGLGKLPDASVLSSFIPATSYGGDAPRNLTGSGFQKTLFGCQDPLFRFLSCGGKVGRWELFFFFLSASL